MGIVNRIGDEPDVDQLAAVFRSANGGTAWTLMDLPMTLRRHDVPAYVSHLAAPAGDPLGILPSGQGTIDFSIAADPTNANIVYVGGCAQLSIGSASAIGAPDYTARCSGATHRRPPASNGCI